ncbi:HAD-IA family hydrolase [Arthrobacter sp. H20]|uniref:HAD-IA family hydrolase n=1 Tax=Arthrobacter sp. H20 TaxID=1267981 RepID=UPI0004B93B38|nr:HAD-IA family hydrolase [Arthrobacter sp. H20]
MGNDAGTATTSEALSKPLEALVLDLDGVLRIWDPAIMADAERDNNLPAGSLAAVAFGDTKMLQNAITGAITDGQWRGGISDKLETHYGTDAKKAVAQWSSHAGMVNEVVLNIVRRVRKRRTVALFSNATTRLDSDLSCLDLTDEFDLIFNSSVIGIAKPSPESFKAVLVELGIPGDRCLFVDDTLINTRSAEGLGFNAHHFRGARALEEFIASCGGRPS